MTETWKDIPRFCGWYQASTLGRIRSRDRFVTYNTTYFEGGTIKRLRKGKVLKNSISPNGPGYPIVQLGYRNYRFVHRLIAETFLGECPKGMEVMHKDDDRTNTRLDNLSYGTRLQNIQDMWLKGRGCTPTVEKRNKS